MHYHDDQDAKYAVDLRGAAPDAVNGFIDFDAAVFAQGAGRLSLKTRELIAVAVATTTQCPFCIEGHVRGAKAAGATQDDVAEAVMVSAALRAGAAFAHGWLAMKTFGQVG